MELDVRILRNPRAPDRVAALAATRQTLAAAADALAHAQACPLYRPTPLLSLTAAADALGVAEVLYKDEAGRFGLGSFKALGGAYAVGRLLSAHLAATLNRPATFDELVGGAHRDLTRRVTVACASDGNHGRSVAAGARLFGCVAVIFLHEGVSEARAEAIRSYGAQVVRTAGDYDDSVAAAVEAAAAAGWELVSDTALPGVRDSVVSDVMQGYTVMVQEVLDELRLRGAAPLTHVFLQAGVGGMAAAVAAHLLMALPPEAAPVFVVVEPHRADCLYQSALAGRRRPANGDLATVMAGLSCGEVSELAWPVLQAAVAFFVSIPDRAAVAAMGQLARGELGAVAEAGESATAGLAALLAIGRGGGNPLGLEAGSRVLLIGTEGATDPEIYARLVSDGMAAP